MSQTTASLNVVTAKESSPSDTSKRVLYFKKLSLRGEKKIKKGQKLGSMRFVFVHSISVLVSHV